MTESYKYVIERTVLDNINNFYTHVAMKYRNTYSYEDMEANIYDAIYSINKIENGLSRRKPILSKWKGYYMANTKKWYYAYKIENQTIIVVDAIHAQNIHEHISKSKKSEISVLKNFHSWMQRLDEVKGERPTYWCQ